MIWDFILFFSQSLRIRACDFVSHLFFFHFGSHNVLAMKKLEMMAKRAKCPWELHQLNSCKIYIWCKLDLDFCCNTPMWLCLLKEDFGRLVKLGVSLKMMIPWEMDPQMRGVRWGGVWSANEALQTGVPSLYHNLQSVGGFD